MNTPTSPQPRRIDLKTIGLAALFDLEFNQFITLKLVKVLYVIGMVIAAIATLVFAFSGFQTSAMAGLITLIVSPVVLLLWLLGLRVYLELVVALIRIAQNTSEMLNRMPERSEGA